MTASADHLRTTDDLYFVRAGDALKIGRTTNIAARLAKMQVDNHEELNCLLLARGQGLAERAWHRHLRAHRIRGEWFRWTPEIEAIMQQLLFERRLSA
jgi:hypothetical protein